MSADMTATPPVRSVLPSLLLSSVLWAGGCCAVGTPYLVRIDGVAVDQPPDGARPGLLADFAAHLARCEAPEAPPPADRYTMLLLSWGGSYGAWGAGFMAGWHDSPAPPPRFRIVTGISTGAIMAVPAFLGGEYDRGLLADGYTLTLSEQIFRPRLPWEIGCFSSLFTARPLMRLIDRAYPDRVVDRVAAEARKGRRLYIVTTDLERAESKVWDLTAIAASASPDRYRWFRGLLLASASIPSYFEPVQIDGHLHVDGGVGMRIWPDDLAMADMADLAAPVIERLRKRLAAGDAPAAAALRARIKAAEPAVWVVVNTRVNVPPEPVGDTVLALSTRTIGVLVGINAERDVRRVADVCRRAGWDDFRATYIPRSVSLAGLQFSDFDPPRMQRIYSAGFDYGREGRWERFLPRHRPDPPEVPPPAGM